MTMQLDVLDDPNYVKYLDHGFVGLLEVMGSDETISQSARVSYGGNDSERTREQDRNLIRYLYRSQHTSPFEMVELRFHLKMPLFVMRQHVRHRTASLNEYSGRYSVMTDEMYMPPHYRLQTGSATNKQGSGEILPVFEREEILFSLKNVYEQSYQSYKDCLKDGLSKEVARIQLPLATYTELYWKIDLHNFLNYVHLRNDPDHAQSEIVDLAGLMYQMVKTRVPLACEAFEDYTQNALKFSRMELKALSQLFDDVVVVESLLDRLLTYVFENTRSTDALSEREQKEFTAKIKRIIGASNARK